ncbi:MAG: endopeptidase La [Mycoplasma sp.]|nr:endopeptidase La [Mycoplasma sp.]
MNNPVLITRGIVVFPNTKKKLIVGRKKSINAIVAANNANKQIYVFSQKDPNTDEPNLNQIYCNGTLCEIVEFKKIKEDEYNVVLKGLNRIITRKFVEKNNYVITDAEIIKEERINTKIIKEKFELMSSLLLKYVKQQHSAELKKMLNSSCHPCKLVDQLANIIPMSFKKAQAIIEQTSLVDRIETICSVVANPDDAIDIENKINNKINQELSKQQKEFYLRQKLGAIKEELGQISSTENDIKNLKNKVNTSPYPENVKKRAFEEISRMESTMNPQENSITRSYLDWLLNLPYWQHTQDKNDITNVENTLNKTHYGLEKVKERIVEYLAVRTKSPNSKSPIICLVGPPGVGKSTLAKSIADALGKKFVKMSLGGVHDESEIRGHRKTYLGSMPGRIIKGMKNAEVVNPLFLLDELDKMTNDNLHGDPASALLEVLDPEQNTSFIDNYIEEPYDLSKVMFVATANYAEQIPEPLYDRLEIIELTSYTEREKLQIAKNYLIPKIYKQTTLTDSELKFEDEAISYIISRYTKEAGVRELERLINKIARKFIVKQLHKEIKTQTINIEAVRKYLDKEIYDYNVREKDSIPGIVNGMAYTTAGGDLLPIEVTCFDGKGQIIITGNLKETMKESATVAIGYVKANADKYGLKNFNFKNKDIHIHVPQGGIPKDGPSAGVTLTTAVISALTKRSVPSNIAMTGEITLRGKVLIIGGIKEKVISAFRGGVNEIFIPKSDERFLKDVPEEVKNKIRFHLVEKYSEIYNNIFKKNSSKEINL